MLTPILARARVLFKSIIITCIIICGVFHLLTPSVARTDLEDEEYTPEGFLREYRDRLSRLKSYYKDVIIEGVSGTTTHTNFTYVSSGEDVKLELKREKPEYFNRVLVSSANRKFVVRRMTAKSSYFLENLFDSNDQWQVMKEYAWLVAGAAYSLSGVPDYLDRVNSSKFTIKRVSRVAAADAILLNVEFEYINSSDLTAPKLRGWFRVQPRLGWVIRGYDYERRYAILRGKRAGQEAVSRVEGWVTYTTGSGEPVPTEIQMKSSTPEGRLLREDHYTISRFVCASSPPSDFSLGAFGLGDLERTARQVETRNNYWTAAVAVAAFLMSLLLLGIGNAIRKRRAHGRVVVSTTDQSPEDFPRGKDS